MSLTFTSAPTSAVVSIEQRSMMFYRGMDFLNKRIGLDKITHWGEDEGTVIITLLQGQEGRISDLLNDEDVLHLASLGFYFLQDTSRSRKVRRRNSDEPWGFGALLH